MRELLERLIGARARRRAQAVPAHRLYSAAVAQARNPAFYVECRVPDTLDGRFDMIVLHLFLLIRRLRREGEAGAALAQALFDTTFDDMDRSVREMGVGDLGVGRRVKAMARAFYGRAEAYERALAAAGSEPLAAALARNLFGGAAAAAEEEDALDALAGYVRAAEDALAGQPAARLLAGEACFPAPPRRG